MSEKAKKIDRGVVRRLLVYTRPYRGYLAAAMAAAKAGLPDDPAFWENFVL